MVVAGVVAVLAASQLVFAANRAPATYGEIYRVAADGRVTNLSHSPAADTHPAVSPDGRYVAFARERATSVQLYVVGSDGRGLHAVSSRLRGGGLHDAGVDSISWSPDSRRIAVSRATSVSSSTMYLTTIRGGWHVLERGVDPSPGAWSPDGRRIAVSTVFGLVDVLDASSGRRLWRAAGESTSAWSRHGLLAVRANSATVTVYDPTGRERSSFPGVSPAWSGDRLASMNGGTLEIRIAGAGTPVLRARLLPKRAAGGAEVEWIGTAHVRALGGDARWHGYDVVRRRAWALPAAARAFASVVSARGVGAFERGGTVSDTLVRGTAVLRTAPSCSDEPQFEQLQFVGRTNALVYQSGCVQPSNDIYSLSDAATLTQVTATPFDEVAPAVSTTGSIAFSRQQFAERCKGCPHELWLAPALQLTKHAFDEPAPFDDDATFAPDGTQLVFVRSGADSRPTLFTVPAAGGAATSLGLVEAGHPAWGARGIAYVQGFNPAKVSVLDPVTRAVTTLASVPGDSVDIGGLAWSRDGRLAYLTVDGAGRASIATVGGRTIALTQRGVSGLAWSPDGTRFAFVAQDANGWGEVFTIRTDGSDVQQLTRNLGVAGTLSWR
jgi:Tol biopolymer transport system component